MPFAVAVARRIRRALPNCVLLVGGTEITDDIKCLRQMAERAHRSLADLIRELLGSPHDSSAAHRQELLQPPREEAQTRPKKHVQPALENHGRFDGATSMGTINVAVDRASGTAVTAFYGVLSTPGSLH